MTRTAKELFAAADAALCADQVVLDELADAQAEVDRAGRAGPGLVERLAAAQAEFPEIEKKRLSSQFSSKYADLSDILNVVRPVLARHGLALVQVCTTGEHGTLMHTAVLCPNSKPLVSVIELPVDGLKPQEIGSLRTYLRRYEICAILGIAPGGEDDDGQGAQEVRAVSRRGDSATKAARDSVRAPVGKAGGGVTSSQSAYIGDLWAKCSIGPTQQAAFTERVVGRQATVDQLTYDEGKALLDALLSARRGEWPDGWPPETDASEPF